jgi:DNA-directed RNA polymerase specialized sigma24 family protein
VDDDQQVNPALVEAVEKMLADGTIEGLRRRLRRDYPNLADHVDDAVSTAIERLILRNPTPDKPANYFAAIAFNEMKAIAKKQARQISLSGLSQADDEEGSHDWDQPDGDWSVEERALWSEVYKDLRCHVETWNTANVRVITLLYLEASYLGEPLTSAEAAELASQILGSEIDGNAARTWKSRGYRKLRDYAASKDLKDYKGDPK